LIRYCPVCDGYEAIDRKVGVIAKDASGVREALYLRHFTDRLTVFLTAEAAGLTNTDRTRLADAGIHLAQGRVDSIRQSNQGAITVRHGERDTTCDMLYSALGMRVHSSLAQSLGAQADASGYLVTDRHQATGIEGLYAAGDVVSGLNQISVAAGGAAIATGAMHLELCAADSDSRARLP
jgi:thioredoxin reductase (NADPH)